MTKWKFADIPGSEARLKPHSDAWIANAFSTVPIDEEARRVICKELRALYRTADLSAPKTIVFVSSPLVAARAGTIACGALFLLGDEDRQIKFCGRVLSAIEMRAAINLACSRTPPATYAATDAATHDATDAATDAATYAATHDATYAATDAATRAATYAATHDATYAATRAATDAATHDATDAATDAATYATTHDVTDDHVGRAAAFMRACGPKWNRPWNGGSDWSAGSSYLSFGRAVGRTDINYNKWIHYERLAQLCGPRFVTPTFAIVVDRPHEFVFADGKAVRRQYGDGVTYHYENGKYSRWLMEPMVAPRPTHVYRLKGSNYCRKAGTPDARHAAEWANLAKLAKLANTDYTYAEQQMLAWAGV